MANAKIDENSRYALIVVDADDNEAVLRVTGQNLTNSQPIHVAVVDGTGSQITTFPVSATNLDIRNLTSTDVVTVTGGACQTADVKITLDGETIASSPYAIKITESGNYTYIGKATAGAAQASAVWQIFRIDETIGLVILWCDGDSLFNNIA